EGILKVVTTYRNSRGRVSPRRDSRLGETRPRGAGETPLSALINRQRVVLELQDREVGRCCIYGADVALGPINAVAAVVGGFGDDAGINLVAIGFPLL